VRLITASLRRPESEPDWQEIVASSTNQTLVFYMGLKKLSLIMQRLESNGMAATMPVAVVDKACTKEQALICADLNSIAEQVKAAKFDGPAMIIVGNVLNYRQVITEELLSSSLSHIPMV
jgi:siroheme synthase